MNESIRIQINRKSTDYFTQNLQIDHPKSHPSIPSNFLQETTTFSSLLTLIFCWLCTNSRSKLFFIHYYPLAYRSFVLKNNPPIRVQFKGCSVSQLINLTINNTDNNTRKNKNIKHTISTGLNRAKKPKFSHHKKDFINKILFNVQFFHVVIREAL